MIVVRASLIDESAVERGPDGLPVAFRMWRAGANETSKGTHILTEKSVALILEEQKKQARKFSFDVDHLSLSDDAPPAARIAVGWFNVEERDGDLWVTNIEWGDLVRAGMSKDPPEWRFFSPAYGVDKKTDEILSLVNCAITNNPATFAIPALASRAGVHKETTMNEEEMRAALAAWAGDDEEKKSKAAAAIKAAFPPADEKKEGEGEKKETKKTAEGGGEGEGGEHKEPDGDEAEKKAAATVTASRSAAGADPLTAKLLARVDELEAHVESTKKSEEDRERAAIFASRPDIYESTKKILASEKPERIKELFATIPQKARPNMHIEVSPTRGHGQRGSNEPMTATRYSDRADELDRKMLGIRKEATVREEGGGMVIATMTPSQAREHMKIVEARRTAASKAEVK